MMTVARGTGEVGGRRRHPPSTPRRHRRMPVIPGPDIGQHRHRQQRDQREPADAALAARQHDERRQQRPGRRAGRSAQLKQRLRETVASAGSHACHAGRLGMEHRGANADQSRGDHDQWIGVRHRQHQQSDETAAHGDRQRERLRVAVGHQPNHRLQHGRGQLRSQGDHANLSEIKSIGRFEERIKRGDQRLIEVVQHVTHAQ